jgi:hypothetical protein
MSHDASPPDLALTTDARVLAGRYRLLEKIGQGGMGAVFRAHDTQLGRTVAVKLLPAGKLADGEAVARFQREARALARLSHANIIQAHDSGQDGVDHFLVMEFVEGHSLARELAEKGRLAPTRAADYAHQAALALHHAHRHGLVHRDVKPSNLLVSPDGRVKLLDLGLARFLQDQVGDGTLTREGAGLGTPDYAAPEQFRDAHRADVRADIYSLGCTLYHLVAGRVPFPGSSLAEKLEAHLTREPPPLEELSPDIPAGLVLIVQRLMAKRPGDRFPSMAEVAEVLAPYVAGSSPSFQDIRNTSTRSGTHLSTMMALPYRRKRVGWLVVAGAAAAVVVVAGLMGLAAGWFRPGTRPLVESSAPAPADTQPAAAAETAAKPRKSVTDPHLLTVSKDPHHGARFSTIGAALDAVRPGETIRVLDDAVYREGLRISGPERRGIELEAVRGATLEVTIPGVPSLAISNVPGLGVRGFRLRAKNSPRTVLVVIRGDCPGLRLERLELYSEGAAPANGIEYYGGSGPDSGRPALIRGCTFRRLAIGASLVGEGAGTVTRVGVRDGLFLDCFMGARVTGRVNHVQIVGNRFAGASMAATELQSLATDARDILVANNTFEQCNTAFRLWDRSVKGRGVRVRNNLLLACQGADMAFIEADDRNTAPAPGDGKAVARAYDLGYNWREGRPATASKEWVPADTKKGDVFRDKVPGVNRDVRSAEFLRPDPDCPLATGGAGRDDPTLPCYVGALPAKGSEPWDWERTWRLPSDAQLLTVSRAATDGGRYRSINDALAALKKPWATIRVLDAATYRETVALDQQELHEGLLLEAPKRASLAPPPAAGHVLLVRGVPRVRVRGFRFRQEAVGHPPLRYLVLVKGQCPGLCLEGIQFRPVSWSGAVTLQEVAGSAEEPVCVAGCRIDGGSMTEGVGLVGPTQADTLPSRYVVIRDNRISGVLRGVNLQGALADVQVVGNVITGAVQTGLGCLDLTPNAERLLLANNTVSSGGCGLWAWCDPGYDLRAGQVEVRSNLILDNTVADMAACVGTVTGMGQASAEKGQAATELWRFGGNWRDLGGSAALIPLAAADHKLDAAVRLERNPSRANFLRPDPSSNLATEGAGKGDPSLPLYVGALPPAPAPAWDWARSWRARVGRAADRH